MGCNGTIVEKSPGVTNQGSEWSDSFNPLISPASAANTGTINVENWTQKQLDLFICYTSLQFPWELDKEANSLSQIYT